MDQQKIGAFISQRRKAMGMTQLQLAETLGITDRAVSKWENGRSLPDAALMLALCDLLGITVNDLLSGEVLQVEDYNKELENKLIEMVRQKEESDKRLLALEWVIGILSLIVLLAPVTVAALVPMAEWKQLVVAFSGFIPGIIGFGFALRIEQVAGYYECGHCQHKYVPHYWALNFAPHVGRTRYMKCPACHKWSWQKKKLTKD